MKLARYYVFLVLANLFWSGNFIVGHFVAGRISPVQLTLIRWAMAAVLLTVAAALIERPRLRDALREWSMHIVLSGLGLIAYCLFSYQALAHTTALNAALVGSINPAVIAVLAVVIARERMRPTGVMGLVISLVGVLLVLTNGQLLDVFAIEYDVGELYMLGAIAAWTGYTILGRRIATAPITATAIQSVIAAIVLAPVALVAGGEITLEPVGWWGVVYIGIFPSVLSFVMWNMSVKKVGAGKAGVYINLMPVFTALLGLAFGLPITGVQIVGGALVILGVYFTSRPVRSPSTIDA